MFFVQGCPQRDTHKIPKIVCWLADTLRECSKLGRHGSSRMSAAAWLEIPDFAVRLPPHVYLEL